MGILENNERALKRAVGEKFVHAYKQVMGQTVQRCEIEELADGEKVICRLDDNGRRWRLNSLKDPKRAAERYAERYGKIQDYSVLCFFGLSDGKVIRNVLANCNDTQQIIIYEPDIDIFATAIQYFALEDIWERANVYLVVKGINDMELENIIFHVVTYQNRALMMHCILPNYDILYPEEGRNQIDLMMYYNTMEIYKKNTEIKFSSRMGDNVLANLPHLLRGSSVLELAGYFKGLELGEVPAIIVSAGPSLDQNIHELKQAEGKAFIIGVDSALKALLREGIAFQMAVSVDAKKNPDVFSDERVYQYPFVLSAASVPLIAERSVNRMFFETDCGLEVFQKIFSQKTGKNLGSVWTGGSVSTNAFSLAAGMGFKNIVLLGQDLAFTDGRGHVSGFEKSEEINRDHVNQSLLTEVEALDGGTIVTDFQMDSYRQWFEREIEKGEGRVTVYNASAGGARIHGAVEMPLREVVEKLCTKKIDFDAHLQAVPQTFTEQEQQELHQEFLKLPEYITGLQNKLKKGVSLYEELIEMEQKHLQETPEYREVLRQVYEINEIEDSDFCMSLIELYAKESEFEASENIYETEEMDVMEIVERGKRMLAGYVEGCEVCRQHMEEILLPRLAEGNDINREIE